jgi:hypothetical protein
MGIVTGLLLWPITGPVRAFRFLIERLHAEAEAVLRDEGRAFAELVDLSMRHNAGQLSDDEYAEQEAELLARLNSIRDYRNELLTAEADEHAMPDGESDEWSLDGEWEEGSHGGEEEAHDDWDAEPWAGSDEDGKER